MSNGQGGPQGPVSPGTMLQMQGAMQMERGLARLWSVGSSETVKSAYQASGQRKGAVAAENIRQRFYRKEFEQIMETQVKPLTDGLTSAREAYGTATQTTVMPITSVLSAEQRAERTTTAPETMMAANPDAAGLPSDPSGAGAGAPPSEIEVPDPQGQRINQIGMEETDTSEKIAIRDPISGQPVPLSSARGIAIWQDAASEFGVQFAKTNQSLMEVMSKYTGNPFASRYGEALIDNLSKQAGVQASGRMDPKEQQEWWEERQKFEADEARAADLNDRQADANERANEGHEQSMALGEQKIDANSRGVEDADRAREDEAIAREQQEAERAVEFNVGINNANDGKLNEHLAPELLKRLNAGEELSDGDKFTIAAANQRWEADEKAGIATEKSAKYFRVNNLENPETWMMDFQTTGSTGSGSNVFHALYNQEKAAAGNSLRLDYRADKSKTPEEKIAELERQGVHPTEAEWFVTDGTVSESVNLAFEQMAMTPEANLEANFRAGMQTLAHSEQMQTGMREKVTETIETYIEDMAANGTPLSEEHADRTRLDRHQSFLKIVNNGPPIPDADRGRYRSKQVQAALTGHYAKWDGIKLGRRSVINKEQERAELTRLNTETATRPRQGPQPAHPDYKPSHSKLKERVNFWANRVEQIKKTGGVPRGALQSLRKAEFKLNRQLELDKNTTATSSTIGAPAAIAKTSTIGAPAAIAKTSTIGAPAAITKSAERPMAQNLSIKRLMRDYINPSREKTAANRVEKLRNRAANAERSRLEDLKERDAAIKAAFKAQGF